MGKKEKVVGYMERIKQAIIGSRRYSTSQGSLVTKASYKDTERAIKAVEPIVAEIQTKLDVANTLHTQAADVLDEVRVEREEFKAKLEKAQELIVDILGSLECEGIEVDEYQERLKETTDG